ncbi:hypothetical protein [Alteromonas sp. AMM-1]|uniref:hypothetical protein n=1 Tax=Alteromonas sp. AMM-1 TaxID=3394233 RepID=UPI0039A670FD
MARLSEHEKIQPHWFTKSVAATLLGLLFSFALIGLFAWYGPGGIQSPNKVQFNMWMISPVWLLILSFSFLFRTGWRAVLMLGAANLVAWAVFLLLRFTL